MKIHTVTFILLIVGGLNWLLTGVVNGWDLAAYIGGVAAMIVYVLVGASAIYEIFTHKSLCRNCNPQGSM